MQRSLRTIAVLSLLIVPPAFAAGVPDALPEAGRPGPVISREPGLAAEVRVVDQPEKLFRVFMEHTWTATLEAMGGSQKLILRNQDGATVGETPLLSHLAYSLDIVPWEAESIPAAPLTAVTAIDLSEMTALDVHDVGEPARLAYAGAVCKDTVNCVNTRMDEGCSSCIHHHADGVQNFDDVLRIYGCNSHEGCKYIAEYAAGYGPFDIGWVCKPHLSGVFESTVWTRITIGSSVYLDGNTLGFWVTREC